MFERAEFLVWVAALSTVGCAAHGTPAAPAEPARTFDTTQGPQAAPAATPEASVEAPAPLVEQVDPPSCASWVPDAGCEGASMVRGDCDAVVETLSASSSTRAFECAMNRRIKNAVCGVSFATCVREELNRPDAPRATVAECAAVQKECTQRRDARVARYGSSGFEPWLVTTAECERAVANVTSAYEDDLFECLRFSCHPTACFTGGPAGLVGRKAHREQIRRAGK